jgi:hypothetical protein
MPAPIDKLIMSAMKCGKCKGKFPECGCYETCSCGWFAEAGKPCGNPKTADCSTKKKHGKRPG